MSNLTKLNYLVLSNDSIGVSISSLLSQFPEWMVTESDGGKSPAGWSPVVPVLIAAIQELSQKLEAAEARIAALESK